MFVKHIFQKNAISFDFIILKANSLNNDIYMYMKLIFIIISSFFLHTSSIKIEKFRYFRGGR